MRRARAVLAVLATLASASCKVDARQDYLGDQNGKPLGFGHTPAPGVIAAQDIDVTPSGAGLPAGSGNAAQGAPVFASQCAGCHGANGQGQPPYPQLIGGQKGTFDFANDPKLVKTIGNYWPYATTLFDYIRRSMPLTAPGSLSADQTYAVTAYLLEQEGVIPPGTVIDARSLPQVKMPGRDHFVPDDRRGSAGGKNAR